MCQAMPRHTPDKLNDRQSTSHFRVESMDSNEVVPSGVFFLRRCLFLLRRGLKMRDQDQNFITRAELAAEWRVSECTVYRYVRLGMPAYGARGNAKRFILVECNEWQREEHKKGLAAAAAKRAMNDAGASLVPA